MVYFNQIELPMKIDLTNQQMPCNKGERLKKFVEKSGEHVVESTKVRAMRPGAKKKFEPQRSCEWKKL